MTWLTDHEDKICRFETPNIDKNIKEQFTKFVTIYTDYVNGKYCQPSWCKKPCKSIKIKSEFSTNFNLGYYTSTIDINFNPIIKTTKSILKTDVMDVINNVGSSMGLWLGFSTFSIFQICNDYGLSCMNGKCTNKPTQKRMLLFVFKSLGIFNFCLLLSFSATFNFYQNRRWYNEMRKKKKISCNIYIYIFS